MVWMKDCTVEIVTQTEGKRTRFSAAGKTDGSLPRTVVYAGEDGEIELAVSPAFLRMRRRGAVGTEACFRVGEEEKFRLSAGGKEGEVPISTERYRAVFRKEGVFIRLVYTLLYHEPQTFSLKIAIRSISEER